MTKGCEDNIRRLIKHTNIKTVQWINLNQREITLKTILKNDSATNDFATKKDGRII